MPSPAGGMTTFLPAVTAGLVVGYSRNPDSFACSKLYKLSPVTRMTGRFPKIRPQEMSRLMDADSRRWADNGARVISDWNRLQFDWITYQTERFQETQPLGYLAVDQADFPVMEAQSQQIATRSMLFRAKQLHTLMQTSGTYPSGHSATATAAGGGFWGAGTTTNRYIQASLQTAAQQIEKATHGAVRYTDLTLVVSPTVAFAMAKSAEIAEGFVQSQFAEGLVTGDAKWVQAYGLPPKLYGMNVVVDNTIETTTNVKSDGTATAGYVPSANEAYILARPGELVNNTGIATDFATYHCFVYKDEEMKSETIDDPINKRKLISVVDNFQILPVATETAYRFTAVLS